MLNPTQMVKIGLTTLNKNAPAILTAFGAAGVVGTAVLTARASFEAAEIIRDTKLDLAADLEGSITSREEVDALVDTMDKIKLTWTLYVPAATTGAISIAAIIMSHRISSKRAAVLAAAYALNEDKIEKYQDKLKEKFGVKKEQETRDELHQDKVTTMVNDGGFTFANPMAGKVWIVEEYSGTPFLSTIEEVKKAANEINAQLNMSKGRDGIKLSAFHKLLGLAPVSMADYVGFTQYEPIELHWSTATSPDGSIPVHVFEYANRPTMELGANFR